MGNSHFKTALMLFNDIMKKIENNLIPSNQEVNELYVKATEGWNFLKDESLIEKINMSKIRLFCKYFEVLITDEGKTLKNMDSLEGNERSYLSSFVNMELSRLEELSRRRFEQDFIDFLFFLIIFYKIVLSENFCGFSKVHRRSGQNQDFELRGNKKRRF